MMDEDRLAAERRARVLIDRQLSDAGWLVQDRKDLNLFAGQGVAGQLVVEGLARALGLNPDAPRGLHKVTQTDT